MRWGVITTPPTGTRLHYRLGRLPAFGFAVFATFAFGWRLHAIALDAGHDRITLAMLGWLATSGTLFVIAAWALTATLPLDVAIDDAGLTYAGATRTWSDVRGVTRSDDIGIVVHGETDLRLRPGSKATIDRLEAEIRTRISASEVPAGNVLVPMSIAASVILISPKRPRAHSWFRPLP